MESVSQEKSDFVVRSERVGVVLIHGIGAQQRGETLDDFVQCLTHVPSSGKSSSRPRRMAPWLIAAAVVAIVIWYGGLGRADGVAVVALAALMVSYVTRRPPDGSPSASGLWQEDTDSAPPQLQVSDDVSPFAAQRLQVADPQLLHDLGISTGGPLPKTVDVYECYWAPLFDGRTTMPAVGRWLLGALFGQFCSRAGRLCFFKAFRRKNMLDLWYVARLGAVIAAVTGLLWCGLFFAAQQPSVAHPTPWPPHGGSVCTPGDTLTACDIATGGLSKLVRAAARAREYFRTSRNQPHTSLNLKHLISGFANLRGAFIAWGLFCLLQMFNTLRLATDDDFSSDSPCRFRSFSLHDMSAALLSFAFLTVLVCPWVRDTVIGHIDWRYALGINLLGMAVLSCARMLFTARFLPLATVFWYLLFVITAHAACQSWTVYAVAVAIVYYAYQIAQFALVEVIGDIQIYVTQNEHASSYAARAAVLKRALFTVSSVLKAGETPDSAPDSGYDRVVVVGHSLGTMIGLDILTRLFRDDELGAIAKRKISHFVTYGSPLEKTYFFFDRERGTGARDFWRRVMEMRAAWPFEWINVWLPSDVVANKLRYLEPGQTVTMETDCHPLYPHSRQYELRYPTPVHLRPMPLSQGDHRDGAEIFGLWRWWVTPFYWTHSSYTQDPRFAVIITAALIGR